MEEELEETKGGNQNSDVEAGQITQWTKEEEQISQWTKEEGQITQWPKEKGKRDR